MFFQLNEKKSSALYYAPPENSLVASYRDALEKFPVSVNQERWSKEERENLLKGVKQQFQETMLQRAIDLRYDLLTVCKLNFMENVFQF